MPREAVHLCLESLFPPEPGATFFSTIAYPDPTDAAARERFWFSLCRWAILEQCRLDPTWAVSVQAIRADVFMRYNNDWWKNFSFGLRRFNHRLTVAQYILLPKLRASVFVDPIQVEGFAPTVENLGVLAMDFMKSKANDQRNLKTRIWNPSRPVVHAAAAFALMTFARRNLPEEVNPLGNRDPFFACLSSPELLKLIISVSEAIRKLLPFLKGLKVREEETIQFVCDSPGS
jgi:hypothetical protein